MANCFYTYILQFTRLLPGPLTYVKRPFFLPSEKPTLCLVLRLICMKPITYAPCSLHLAEKSRWTDHRVFSFRKIAQQNVLYSLCQHENRAVVYFHFALLFLSHWVCLSNTCSSTNTAAFHSCPGPCCCACCHVPL